MSETVPFVIGSLPEKKRLVYMSLGKVTQSYLSIDKIHRDCTVTSQVELYPED